MSYFHHFSSFVFYTPYLAAQLDCWYYRFTTLTLCCFIWSFLLRAIENIFQKIVINWFSRCLCLLSVFLVKYRMKWKMLWVMNQNGHLWYLSRKENNFEYIVKLKTFPNVALFWSSQADGWSMINILKSKRRGEESVRSWTSGARLSTL